MLHDIVSNIINDIVLSMKRLYHIPSSFIVSWLRVTMYVSGLCNNNNNIINYYYVIIKCLVA